MRSRIVIESWMRDRVGVALGESYGFLNQGRRITGSRSKIGIAMFSLLDYAGDLLWRRGSWIVHGLQKSELCCNSWYCPSCPSNKKWLSLSPVKPRPPQNKWHIRMVVQQRRTYVNDYNTVDLHSLSSSRSSIPSFSRYPPANSGLWDLCETLMTWERVFSQVGLTGTPKYTRFVSEIGYNVSLHWLCADFCIRVLALEEPMLADFEACCIANLIHNFAWTYLESARSV